MIMAAFIHEEKVTYGSSLTQRRIKYKIRAILIPECEMMSLFMIASRAYSFFF